MTISRRMAVTAVVAIATVAAATALSTGSAGAEASLSWTSVAANPDVRGIAVPNALSPQLREYAVAQGSNKLENPDGLIAYYGYLANGTLVPDPTVTQAPGTNVEASK